MGAKNKLKQKLKDMTGELISPKCKNCSGYEDKIDVESENLITTEMAEMDKHEIICKIASHMGDDPSLFSKAEDLFEIIKYKTTEYVLRHEFNHDSRLSVQLTLWLEQKQEPTSFNLLEQVMHKYLNNSRVE